MALTLNLSPEIEELLKVRAAGVGQTTEDYVRSMVEREVADSATIADAQIGYPPDFPSAEEWIKALYEWADSFPPINHYVDDSRESIY